MNDLGEILRAHDPARGKALNDIDRRQILARSSMRETPLRPMRLVAAFAMLLVLIVATIGIRREKPQPRQIQYATPGGTRIVWTLDPDFHM